MQSWIASKLHGRSRAKAWNDCVALQMEPLNITPADAEHFEAELRTGDFGPMRVIQLNSGPCVIERVTQPTAHALGSPYSFLFQLCGASQFTHYGHEAALAAGDSRCATVRHPIAWR